MKGALIIGEIKNRKDNDDIRYPLTLEFQFNPESLKRTLKIITPQEILGSHRRQENRQADPRDLKTDSHVGESISITARFDGKIGYGSPRRGSGEDSQIREDQKPYFNSNLLPVLSAIEKLMQPVETTLQTTAKKHHNPPKVLPLVFFWWGERRILPVKITQMTIIETEFSPELSPIRAEVNLEMEVLVPGSRSDDRIKTSYQYVQEKKKEHARMYAEGVNQSARQGFTEAMPQPQPTAANP